jgi:hypothetical protein
MTHVDQANRAAATDAASSDGYGLHSFFLPAHITASILSWKPAGKCDAASAPRPILFAVHRYLSMVRKWIDRAAESPRPIPDEYNALQQWRNILSMVRSSQTLPVPRSAASSGPGNSPVSPGTPSRPRKRRWIAEVAGDDLQSDI